LLLLLLLLLPRVWCCSPVQLEAVGPISVCGVALQVLGQINDHDGLKGAFLVAQAGNQNTQAWFTHVGMCGAQA
jgi:hypothetical protein